MTPYRSASARSALHSSASGRLLLPAMPAEAMRNASGPETCVLRDMRPQPHTLKIGRKDFRAGCFVWLNTGVEPKDHLG